MKNDFNIAFLKIQYAPHLFLEEGGGTENSFLTAPPQGLYCVRGMLLSHIELLLGFLLHHI